MPVQLATGLETNKTGISLYPLVVLFPGVTRSALFVNDVLNDKDTLIKHLLVCRVVYEMHEWAACCYVTRY
jgi:hypothetical protein